MKFICGSLLTLLMLAAPTVSLAQTAIAGCPVSAEHLTVNGGLERSRAAVRAGRLSILALGSSSIEGVGASRKELSFVPLLEAGLRARLPGVEVAVVNKGIGGETTWETANRAERELAAGRFDMAIWALGTNDALRGRPVRDFLTDFRRGQEIFTRANVDVFLIDTQRLPDVPGNVFRPRFPNLAEVSDLTIKEGARVRYAVSSRYGMMTGWGALEGGGVGPDNLHFNDAGYACWAEATAEALAKALR